MAIQNGPSCDWPHSPFTISVINWDNQETRILCNLANSFPAPNFCRNKWFSKMAPKRLLLKLRLIFYPAAILRRFYDFEEVNISTSCLPPITTTRYFYANVNRCFYSLKIQQTLPKLFISFRFAGWFIENEVINFWKIDDLSERHRTNDRLLCFCRFCWTDIFDIFWRALIVTQVLTHS